MAKPKREYFKFDFSNVVKFDCTCGRRFINTSNCFQNTDGRSPQTNADRIRVMSDEELAKLITSGELCAICPFCKYYGTEQCYMENEGVHKNCDSGIIDWLKSEVEVSHEQI